MSSSTALLPKVKKDEHSIFLRVCHSPWLSINQKLLMIIRGFLAIYLTVVFGLVMYYEHGHSQHGWLIIFQLHSIAFFAQVIYFICTFVWTTMHLHYPTATNSSATQQLLSPPRQDSSTQNRSFFSLFYTATLVFPAVVTLGYWVILAPHDHGMTKNDRIFDYGRFEEFSIINYYAINSFIAFVEVMFLSSIKRMEPVWMHTTGLTFLALLYTGWTYIGYAFTDKFVYWFLNYHKIGWEVIVSAVIAFCGIVNAFFAVFYGLTGIREALTARSEDKSYGYNRLPQ